MAQKLRYFVRLDSELTPVIGSNITRTKKPKSGKWQEIFKENCCNVTVTATPTSIPGDTFTFVLSCGSVHKINANINVEVTSVGDAVTALNTAFPFLGVFTASGSDISLAVDSAIASILCPYGALTMTITAA